ncbi:MAG: type II toxin-antitoxin system PemK/MazF family toxin [Chloroflexota bacterium]|nr:MAG: type II toxin-antitoxin system PemK/MazF family toxin [Chloroflexota bacterium]
MGKPLPRRGQIWNVFTPGQPQDPHQPRPALVISADARNVAEDDIIVAPIFTRGATGPTHVPIRRGIGGLGHDSVIFCEEITALDVDSLSQGPLGDAVPESLLRRVVRAVRIAIGDVPMPGD